MDGACKTADTIAAEGGIGLEFRIDVCDMGSASSAFQDVVGKLGPIDVLHNNVGATLMGGPTDLEETAFQRAIDLNLGSLYRTCKAVLPSMIARRKDAIINVSWLAAVRYTGYPYFSYCAAKAAVNRLRSQS